MLSDCSLFESLAKCQLFRESECSCVYLGNARSSLIECKTSPRWAVKEKDTSLLDAE